MAQPQDVDQSEPTDQEETISSEPPVRIPSTPVGPRSSRGRSVEARGARKVPSTQAMTRSRSRESLWAEQAVVQDYLQELGSSFAADFGSVLEHIVLLSTQNGIWKGKESRYHRLTPSIQAKFREALIHEWKTNILRPEAARLPTLEESVQIRQASQSSKRIVPTRWVLVDKHVGPDSDSIAKARLVLQGFRDPDLGDIEVSSPTLGKDAFPLILQILASMRCDGSSSIADIKAAFMSSRPLERAQGSIYAALPKLRPLPSEADPQQFVEVKVAWYCLNDGPREFRETHTQELIRFGCRSSSLDPCVYTWHQGGTLQGILGVTVDDLCGGGSQVFRKEVMDALSERFHFGKFTEGSGRFTGRLLRRLEDFSIKVDQLECVSRLETLDVPCARRQQGKNLSESELHCELRQENLTGCRLSVVVICPALSRCCKQASPRLGSNIF